jgi:hypothetical protein
MLKTYSATLILSTTMNAIVTVFKLLASVGTLYTTINYRI